MNPDEYCLQDLIDKVESDDRILQFRFQYKNMLVWPFVRVYAYWAKRGAEEGFVNNDLENKEVLAKKIKKKRRLQIIFTGLRMIFHMPFFWKQKDILYLYNSRENITIDGQTCHRIYGDFVSEFSEQTGVIETLGDSKYKKDKSIDKRYIDSINLFIEILSYFSKNNPKDIQMADNLIDYLCNECGIDFSPYQSKKIKKTILDFSIKIKCMDKILPKVFKTVRPKIVFVECADYGGSNAYINKTLHEMGIKIAEAQHGIIGGYHEAYTHSDFLCNNAEYAEYMVDYFLGYGDYWLEKINIPGEKIALGNPWFWRQYTRFLNKKHNNQSDNHKKKTVLWIPFEDYKTDLDVLEGFIRDSNNEYNIRVRLHPIYNKFKSDYKKYEDDGKIIMDELPTIYDSLDISDYVVSERSTVIYEALAFGKPAFIFESEYSVAAETLTLGPNFKNAAELVNLLHNAQETTNVDPDNRSKFFGEQWQDKFKQFINRVLADCQ